MTVITIDAGSAIRAYFIRQDGFRAKKHCPLAVLHTTLDTFFKERVHLPPHEELFMYTDQKYVLATVLFRLLQSDEMP